MAALELGYGSRDGQTQPLLRKHVGPLRVLKGYRPDGADCWEQVIVHPPGGIASCDQLSIDVDAGADAHVLLTTPGATKWYRAGPGGLQADKASQRVNIAVAPGATVEWLPLENIFYDGVDAELENSFELAAGAGLICAELSCLGRPAAQAPFEHGRLAMRTRIAREGRLIFSERIALAGQDRAMQAPAGLNGYPCFGTLVAVPAQATPEGQLGELVAQVRTHAAQSIPAAQFSITALPASILVRWRGDSAEAGWQALRLAWQMLREPLLGLAPQTPRIWAC